MQKYVIALYIRLSIEDYKYDSLSIENHEFACAKINAIDFVCINCCWNEVRVNSNYFVRV